MSEAEKPEEELEPGPEPPEHEVGGGEPSPEEIEADEQAGGEVYGMADENEEANGAPAEDHPA